MARQGARQDTHLTQSGATVQELLNKVDGIEDGAEVNEIDTIEVNGTVKTPVNKKVALTIPVVEPLDDEEIDEIWDND